MAISVVFDADIEGLMEDIEAAAELALEEAADNLLQEVRNAQVMPFVTGNLQNDQTYLDTSEIASGKVSIVQNTPYARRLYYHPEYKFTKTENANAGGKWFSNWLPGGKKENYIRDDYEKNVKELLEE